MNNEKLTFWAWFVFIAFVGGILGYFAKNTKPATRAERLRGLAIGISTSMFAAYVTFQIAFYYLGSENISVALSGVSAWMGADAFLAMERAILNNLNNKKEG